MTERDDFTAALEQLEVPRIGELQHQQYVRKTILSAPRSAALTLWYVLIPCYLVFCAVMKSAFLMEPHVFKVFDGIVRQLSESPMGPVLPALLLLGLPALAVFLNLAVLVRGSRRHQPINVLIVLLGLLASGLYLVYLLLRV